MRPSSILRPSCHCQELRSVCFPQTLVNKQSPNRGFESRPGTNAPLHQSSCPIHVSANDLAPEHPKPIDPHLPIPFPSDLVFSWRRITLLVISFPPTTQEPEVCSTHRSSPATTTATGDAENKRLYSLFISSALTSIHFKDVVGEAWNSFRNYLSCE